MAALNSSSYSLRIGRAREHFDALEKEVLAWLRSDPYSLIRNHNSDGSHHFITVKILKEPDISRWSLVAADCIHNLRSALDVLTYAVAIRDSGTDPPADAKRIQFPICSTPDNFASERSRIKGLALTSQKIIEDFQPYNRPHHIVPPLLGMLNVFDNSNKHRDLHIAAQNVSRGHFAFIDKPVLQKIDVYYVPMALKNGAEIAGFDVDPPDLHVNYTYKASFVVTVSHAVGPSGFNLTELMHVLKWCMDEVIEVGSRFGV